MTFSGSPAEFESASGLVINRPLIRQAVEALRAGQVIAIPTDTVYGLAAAIDRPDAIAHLYELKSRPPEKAIPVLLSDPSQMWQLASSLSPSARLLASSFWPGALTLVLPALSHLPSPLTSTLGNGLQTVGVRVPDHPLARAIIAAAGGALAVTSANRSGMKPALEAREVSAMKASPPILVVDGGPARGGVPSTVVLAIEETPVILREGSISATIITEVLRNREQVVGGESGAGYDQPMMGEVRQTSSGDTPA